MVTSEGLHAELAGMPGPSTSAIDGAQERASNVLRPEGALARLDELAVWIAGWHDTPLPRIERPGCLVFAADHGVAAEGVSRYPAEITGAMLTAVQNGQASICALASVAGASLAVFDVGVGRPTGNLRTEPAMSPERFAEAFAAGRSAVADSGSDLLVFGELGIGNTTPAAAVSAAIVGGDVEEFVGRGTGVDDHAYANKVAVVADALERISGTRDPLEKLREVGGAELVAMTGAIVEARSRRIPVLLDGYIATAPALALHAIDPGLISHVRAGHRSAEPGHHRALTELGLSAILDLDMRLGEGSGAMVAVPIVAAACRVVSDVATFDEFFGEGDAEPTP